MLWLVLLVLVAGLRVQAQTTETHSFTNLNRSIPDGNSAGMRDVRMVPSAIRRISSARVRLRIDGEFNGDLYGYVRRIGQGTTNFCVLLNRPGRTATSLFGYDDAGLDVTFDAAAANGDIHLYRAVAAPSPNSPLTGAWQPDGRWVDPAAVFETTPRTAGLESFVGADGAAEWTLYLADTESGGTNLLAEWQLDLSGALLPEILWSPPAPIVYGTALGTAQLSATATFASTNVGGAFVYSPPSGTVLDAGLGQALAVTFTPSDTNLFLSASGSVSLDVTPAPLAVTANSASRAYGDSNPIFLGVIAGIQNADPITAQYSCPATANSPPGAYNIVPTLSDPGGRLVNYSVTTNSGTLTVAPAPLIVTADGQSRPYGATNPALTGTLTGLRNSDHITATYATIATPTSPVGQYAIVPVLLDPDSKLGNYAVSTNYGSLTIFNHAPVLSPIPTQLVNEGNTLTFTISATDADAPPQQLAFSLGPGAPAGASLDPVSGVFSWTPPLSGYSVTNPVSVQVSDNASPPQSSTASFNIVVVPRPVLLSMDEVNGSIIVAWSVLPGLSYQPQYKENLPDASWTALGPVLVATSPTISVTDNPGTNLQRFYRLLQITNP